MGEGAEVMLRLCSGTRRKPNKYSVLNGQRVQLLRRINIKYSLNILICEDEYFIYACRHNQEILSYVYEIKNYAAQFQISETFE